MSTFKRLIGPTWLVRKAQSKKFKGKPMAQFFKKYRLTKQVLGSGHFSQVQLAFDENDNPFAVKILTKDGLNPLDYDGVVKEVTLMKSLIHPNIVRCHEFYEDEFAIYIVMEYATGGELFKEIEARQRYTEEDAKAYVKLLAHALKYCYEKGIIHRDLKPDNILLQKIGQGTKVLLADFGFATSVDPKMAEFSLLQTQCGTPNYVAPEVIEGNPYNYKCDIWSFGVVVFVMLSGYLPFGGRTKAELFANIQDGSFHFLPRAAWANVSETAKDFIKHLICRDPNQRYNYDEMIAHEWLSNDKNYALSDLTENLKELKEFNQKRKLNAATKAIEAAAIFQDLMGKSISGVIASEDPEAVDKIMDLMGPQPNVPVPLSSKTRMQRNNSTSQSKDDQDEPEPLRRKYIFKNQKSYFSFFRGLKPKT